MSDDVCDFCAAEAVLAAPFIARVGSGRWAATVNLYRYVRGCERHAQLAVDSAAGFVSATEGSLADEIRREALA